MKRIHILLSIAVLVLSACQVQVDKTFDASSLTHELDSITEIILSENRNYQLANIDYTPNDKDVDRCIEICDTLIAHEIGPNPIIIKLRTLSIAKRYKEFIEFGNSEICSSHEIYPVPGVFECKLNAMQSHLNGDKDGEKKHIELALEKINKRSDLKKGDRKRLRFKTGFRELPSGNYCLRLNLHRFWFKVRNT